MSILAERKNRKTECPRLSTVCCGLALAQKVLYMAALCATLHNPLIKTYYKAMGAKGKFAKVALTTVMRKLLLRLNSQLKTLLQTRPIITVTVRR